MHIKAAGFEGVSDTGKAIPISAGHKVAEYTKRIFYGRNKSR